MSDIVITLKEVEVRIDGEEEEPPFLSERGVKGIEAILNDVWIEDFLPKNNHNMEIRVTQEDE